ncbi:MAG: tail fiber domain-containing protein [Vicinamibacterales bacterium]
MASRVFAPGSSRWMSLTHRGVMRVCVVLLVALGIPHMGAAQAFTSNVSVTTTNTPQVRLDQTSGGGFTAQAWDVAGNEANFFVRDVTNSSRLPFRIRPGAPTSSLDIAATGNIGIGTSSPAQRVHILQDVNANSFLLMQNSNAGTTAAAVIRTQSDTAMLNFQAHAGARTISRFGQTLGGWNEMLAVSGNGFAIGTFTDVPLVLGANSQMRLRATTAGVEVFGTFTNSSSRDYKEGIRTLGASEAVEALAGLQPVKFRYKAQTKENLGFIAEDVPDLVAMEGRKSIAPMDLIALLTKVVQEQQKTIDALGAKVAELERQR